VRSTMSAHGANPSTPRPQQRRTSISCESLFLLLGILQFPLVLVWPLHCRPCFAFLCCAVRGEQHTVRNLLSVEPKHTKEGPQSLLVARAIPFLN
jgi:hypothetical protein